MENRKKLFNFSKICFAFMLAFVFSIAISNTSEAATLGKPTNLKQTYGSYNTEYGKYFIVLEYNGVSGAAGYCAQMSTDNKNWTFIDEAYKGTEFTIGYSTNLAAGSTYYVRIVPVVNVNNDLSYDEADVSDSIQVVTAPAAVSKVNQTGAGKNSISASWSGVANATGYNVYVKKYGDSTYTLNGSTKSKSYKLTKYKGSKLKNDYLYYVSVCATKTSTAGFTAEALPSTGYPLCTLPSKITKVTGTHWKPGKSTLKVSWKNTNIADGYELQFYNAKGKSIKKVTTTKNAYTFKKAPKNSSMSVKVRPYIKTSKGKKYASWSKKFYFLSQADMSKTTYTINNGLLTLRWKAVTGASKYTVYAGTSSKNMKAVATVSGNSTSCTISRINGSAISRYGYYCVKVVPQKKLGGKTVKGDYGYYWTLY
ncbi:MAG: hypothetical protein IJF03_03145 [Lachnospiraceae bacterium]|nr:hypothetical protein [Lachnospiraceae bacterium]